MMFMSLSTTIIRDMKVSVPSTGDQAPSIANISADCCLTHNGSKCLFSVSFRESKDVMPSQPSSWTL